MRFFLLSFFFFSIVAKKLPAQNLDTLGADSLFKVALQFIRQAKHEDGILKFKEALGIYLKFHGEKHYDVANTYLFLGHSYRRYGVFGEALNYYNKSKAIFAKIPGDNGLKLAEVFNGLGSTFRNMGEYDRALENLKKALTIRLKKLGPDNYRIGFLHVNMANAYDEEGDHASAILFYQKAFPVLKKRFSEFAPQMALFYLNFGDSYYQNANYSHALKLLNKAVSILEKDTPIQPRLAKVFKIIAKCFLEMNNLDNAEIYFQKALLALNFNSLKSDDFEAVNSAPDFLDVLNNLGGFWTKKFERTADSSLLFKALEIYQLGVRYARFAKTSYKEEVSKEVLFNNSFPLFEGAIRTCFQLRKLTDSLSFWRQAFDLSEQSNSILLRDAVQNAHAIAFSGLPDSLLVREEHLKTEIAEQEKLKFEEEQNEMNANSTKINELNNKLFDLKEKYFALIDTFENKYPKYYDLKYAAKTISVGTIQKELLNPAQTMVSYFVGDENIFVFVITAEDFQVVSIKKDFPLEAWIEEFRNSIYNYNPTDPNLDFLNQKYANIGYELYRILFQPIEPALAGKSLVIVPGGVLGYLPFEALLTELLQTDDDFSHHPYLLNRYQISYSYSATLLKEMSQKGDRASHGLLAIAPKFDQQKTLVPSDPRQIELGKLEHNREEAEAVCSIVGGSLLADSLATEQAFYDLAPKYSVLHLATHGFTNDQWGEYSYLAFTQIPDSIENELLFVKDLYQMRLRAQMVVLSACNTGVGELQRGEGIISLARGFFYAGAVSIITTLWQVDDQSTSQIMQYFYGNLKAGMTKDAALWQAKRTYLGNCNKIRAHPLFWAAFVPVGNMEALDLGGGWALWQWGLLFGGVLVLGFGIFVRREKSKR